jgi:hypothetical protein
MLYYLATTIKEMLGEVHFVPLLGGVRIVIAAWKAIGLLLVDGLMSKKMLTRF